MLITNGMSSKNLRTLFIAFNFCSFLGAYLTLLDFTIYSLVSATYMDVLDISYSYHLRNSMLRNQKTYVKSNVEVSK